MFYVYEHLRPDTGIVFYVGKGTGIRATRKADRNMYWKRIVSKIGEYKISKIVVDVDEELAFLVEQERIDQLKRLGVKLANMTLGGEGAFGRKLTQEQKNKISVGNKGKLHSLESYARMADAKRGKKLSEEHKKKLAVAFSGEKNHMFGKTHSITAREKIRNAMKNAPRIECPYCNKSGDSANMKRWHFNNCKQKEQ